MNLLPQGDFKKPGVSTEWAEGFNIPQNNQEFQVVSENGKSWLRIENHDAGRQLDYVHEYVKVTPEIESLTISVRMKATNLKVGTEGWHDARVAMVFEGASGYPAQIPELRADSDWVTKTVELQVPKGATRLNIQPTMFRYTGVFEVADLTITPHLPVAVVKPAQLEHAPNFLQFWISSELYYLAFQRRREPDLGVQAHLSFITRWYSRDRPFRFLFCSCV